MLISGYSSLWWRAGRSPKLLENNQLERRIAMLLTSQGMKKVLADF
jgi:hypothetical protein